LLLAARSPVFDARSKRELDVPLTDAIDGKQTISIDRAIHKKMILIADESTPLTRELARNGRPVVRHLALKPYIGMHVGDIVREATDVFAVATAEGVEQDEALAAEIVKLLRAANRDLGRVRFAAFDGVGKSDRCRLVDTDRDIGVVSEVGFRWSPRATLFLNVAHPLVRAARTRAASNVHLAAHVMCRATILEAGPLTKGEVETLLEAVRP
jgi:hypothetical protein